MYFNDWKVTINGKGSYNVVSILYELAEYVQLSEEHVLEILQHYKNKHGIGTHYGDYSITFEPLRVLNINQFN